MPEKYSWTSSPRKLIFFFSASKKSGQKGQKVKMHCWDTWCFFFAFCRITLMPAKPITWQVHLIFDGLARATASSIPEHRPSSQLRSSSFFAETLLKSVEEDCWIFYNSVFSVQREKPKNPKKERNKEKHHAQQQQAKPPPLVSSPLTANNHTESEMGRTQRAPSVMKAAEVAQIPHIPVILFIGRNFSPFTTYVILARRRNWGFCI